MRGTDAADVYHQVTMEAEVSRFLRLNVFGYCKEITNNSALSVVRLLVLMLLFMYDDAWQTLAHDSGRRDLLGAAQEQADQMATEGLSMAGSLTLSFAELLGDLPILHDHKAVEQAYNASLLRQLPLYHQLYVQDYHFASAP